MSSLNVSNNRNVTALRAGGVAGVVGAAGVAEGGAAGVAGAGWEGCGRAVRDGFLRDILKTQEITCAITMKININSISLFSGFLIY